MSGGRLAVLLLTKNGARHLRESLPAILAQLPRDRGEVIAVDSGSTDGTLELLHRYRVRVESIPPESFRHGPTRNLAAEMAGPRAELLVYLTQDAVPLPGWLDGLAAAVRGDARVAGAFSRHVPRPDCNPLLARRIEEEWPQVGGTARIVKALDGAGGAVRGWHALAHFSNTSSCVRRAVWERLPFPEVDFAEDVAWAGRALRAGYRIVYEPASRVVHSHGGSLLRQLRENVDHGRGVRRVLTEAAAGHNAPAMMPHANPALARVARDAAYIWHGQRGIVGRLRWLAYAPAWYAAALGGQWIGARIDRWPAWLRARLSWQAAVARQR